MTTTRPHNPHLSKTCSVSMDCCPEGEMRRVGGLLINEIYVGLRIKRTPIFTSQDLTWSLQSQIRATISRESDQVTDELIPWGVVGLLKAVSLTPVANRQPNCVTNTFFVFVVFCLSVLYKHFHQTQSPEVTTDLSMGSLSHIGVISLRVCLTSTGDVLGFIRKNINCFSRSVKLGCNREESVWNENFMPAERRLRGCTQNLFIKQCRRLTRNAAWWCPGDNRIITWHNSIKEAQVHLI